MDPEQSNVPISSPTESGWIRIFRATVWLLAIFITGFTLYGVFTLYSGAHDTSGYGAIAVFYVLIYFAPIGLAEILLAWSTVRQLSQSLHRAWIIHSVFLVILISSTYYGLSFIFLRDFVGTSLIRDLSFGLLSIYGIFELILVIFVRRNLVTQTGDGIRTLRSLLIPCLLVAAAVGYGMWENDQNINFLQDVAVPLVRMNGHVEAGQLVVGYRERALDSLEIDLINSTTAQTAQSLATGDFYQAWLVQPKNPTAYCALASLKASEPHTSGPGPVYYYASPEITSIATASKSGLIITTGQAQPDLSHCVGATKLVISIESMANQATIESNSRGPAAIVLEGTFNQRSPGVKKQVSSPSPTVTLLSQAAHVEQITMQVSHVSPKIEVVELTLARPQFHSDWDTRQNPGQKVYAAWITKSDGSGAIPWVIFSDSTGAQNSPTITAQISIDPFRFHEYTRIIVSEESGDTFLTALQASDYNSPGQASAAPTDIVATGNIQ